MIRHGRRAWPLLLFACLAFGVTSCQRLPVAMFEIPPLGGPATSSVSDGALGRPDAIVEIGVGSVTYMQDGVRADGSVTSLPYGGYNPMAERYPATRFIDGSGNEWFRLLSGDHAGLAVRGHASVDPPSARYVSATVVARPIAGTTRIFPVDVFIVRRVHARVTFGGHSYDVDTSADDEAVARTRIVIGEFANSTWAWSDGRIAIDARIVIVDEPVRSVSTLGKTITVGAGDLASTLAAAGTSYRPEATTILAVWYAPSGASSTAGLYTPPCPGCPTPLFGSAWSGANAFGGRAFIQVTSTEDGSTFAGHRPAEVFIHEFLHELAWNAATSGADRTDIDDSGAERPDLYGGWHDRYVTLLAEFAAQLDSRPVMRP